MSYCFTSSTKILILAIAPFLIILVDYFIKKFYFVMMLLIRPSSILKFQFVFIFSKCLWAIFSLLSFENFLSYIWFLVIWVWLWFHNTNDFKSHLTPPRMPINKKMECKDHQLYLKSIFEHNLFILMLQCIMLLVNSVTSKYSFFRRII